MIENEYSTIKAQTFLGKTLSDCQVLIVDDEQASRLILTSVLEEFVRCTSTGDCLIVADLCRDIKPDLVILDVNMPDKDGITICKELKQSAQTVDVPILFITGSVEPSSQDICWEAGAADFIAKPIVASTLIHRVRNLLQSKLRLDLLSELTFRDQLTGLNNRHYLVTEVPAILKNTIRENQFLGVIMIDIDYFKGFNDTYGHVDGDKCLVSVASALKACVRRPKDCVIRYGGEEFLVFLPDTDQQGCLLVGQAIVKTMYELNIVNSSSPNKMVTVSAGYVVTQPNNNVKLEDIINDADQALYEAKQSGRNKLKGYLKNY
ncbi:diguanylate cyclase [Thalassotalea sp. SU-HH00458]|uniref:GGDEF domain-containing response regulator n=1 Tax=Thalassotalea sp. SU-HH00458 TaxID=3127657 RepID=UPI0031094786